MMFYKILANKYKPKPSLPGFSPSPSDSAKRLAEVEVWNSSPFSNNQHLLPQGTIEGGIKIRLKISPSPEHQEREIKGLKKFETSKSIKVPQLYGRYQNQLIIEEIEGSDLQQWISNMISENASDTKSQQCNQLATAFKLFIEEYQTHILDKDRVHGDLRLENIMVTPDFTIVLIDWATFHDTNDHTPLRTWDLLRITHNRNTHSKEEVKEIEKQVLQEILEILTHLKGDKDEDIPLLSEGIIKLGYLYKEDDRDELNYLDRNRKE